MKKGLLPLTIEDVYDSFKIGGKFDDEDFTILVGLEKLPNMSYHKNEMNDLRTGKNNVTDKQFERFRELSSFLDAYATLTVMVTYGKEYSPQVDNDKYYYFLDYFIKLLHKKWNCINNATKTNTVIINHVDILGKILSEIEDKINKLN